MTGWWLILWIPLGIYLAGLLPILIGYLGYAGIYFNWKHVRDILGWPWWLISIPLKAKD